MFVPQIEEVMANIRMILITSENIHMGGGGGGGLSGGRLTVSLEMLWLLISYKMG